MADIGWDEYDEFNWLDDWKVNAKWYEALSELDLRANKKPLIELLQSDQQVPSSIAFYLGDLLDRYSLKPKQGSPRIPAYSRTPEQITWCKAILYVKGLINKENIDKSVALARVAALFGVSEQQLADAIAGKNGAFERARRRWYRPKENGIRS